MNLVRLKVLEKNIEQGEQESPEVFAFCGIGNPNNFFELLRKESFVLRGTKVFSDHHAYTQKDIEEIEKTARKCGAGALLTTAKDAVKLQDLQRNLSCVVFDIEIDFGEYEPQIREILDAL